MTKKVVVVGSINLDLVAYVARMPVEGETIQGNHFASFPGGKGANQAVAASRLGANAAMIGRLGKDIFAAQLREALQHAGVGTDCVFNVEGTSGSAFITVTSPGSNAIIVIPGANAALQPSSLDEHATELRGASVILTQLEVPIETVEYLGQLAKRFDIPLMLDPAPARELPQAMLRNITWLTPNESECAVLLRSMGYSFPQGTPTESDLAEAAGRILATGVRNVALKLGARGVYLCGRDVPPTLVPSFQVQAVDTTAAGDAFNGGFAYGLVHAGMTPAKAARFACAVSAVSVMRPGAQPSMPELAEVEKLLNEEGL